MQILSIWDSIDFFVSGMFVDSIIRSISLIAERVVLYLQLYVYYLFLDVSEMSFLSQTDINSMYQRIYTVIGVFMLFKLAFSFLSFVAEPEKFNDNKSGAGKLITRAMVTLVMLATVPYLFQAGYALQSAILREAVIPNIIMGTKTEEIEGFGSKTTSGLRMAQVTFSAFFRPNMNCSDAEDLYIKYDDAFSKLDIFKMFDLVNDTCKVDGKQRFFIEYIPGIGTIASLLVTYMFLVFTFDVGIRAAKLVFLQLIAPIPIMSYIDPKTAEKTFKSWLTSLWQTYLDIFLRIGSVYFILFVISRMIKFVSIPTHFFTSRHITIPVLLWYEAGTDNVAISQFNPITYVVLIIILLQFAKMLPKWIFTVLGIKPPEGGFSLDLTKKILDTPLVGKLAGGVFSGVDSQRNGGDFNKGFKSGFNNVGLLGGEAKKDGSMAFMKHMPNTFGAGSKKSKNQKEAEMMRRNFMSKHAGNEEFIKNGDITGKGKSQLIADIVRGKIGDQAANQVESLLNDQSSAKSNQKSLKMMSRAAMQLEKAGKHDEIKFEGKVGLEAMEALDLAIAKTENAIKSFDAQIEKIVNAPGRESVHEMYKEVIEAINANSAILQKNIDYTSDSANLKEAFDNLKRASAQSTDEIKESIENKIDNMEKSFQKIETQNKEISKKVSSALDSPNVED
jgi:hypothetical protein